MARQEIFTRRNLPHWYVPGAMHFVTYRLAGTIPQAVLHQLRENRTARLSQEPPQGINLGQHRERAHKQFFADYDAYLDRTSMIDWLARPAIAALIRGNLYHHNGSKYQLLSYCVMPNHVHVLFQPLDLHVAPSGPLGSSPAVASSGPLGSPLVATIDSNPDEKPDATSPLATIMHSLKSYTAHEANKILARSGQFWQHESYDHWVRDDEELQRIVDYIAYNPVKANLVTEPQHWFFSAAHDRFLQDGSVLGYLG
jgi:putative transposase